MANFCGVGIGKPEYRGSINTTIILTVNDEKIQPMILRPSDYKRKRPPQNHERRERWRNYAPVDLKTEYAQTSTSFVNLTLLHRVEIPCHVVWACCTVSYDAIYVVASMVPTDILSGISLRMWQLRQQCSKVIYLYITAIRIARQVSRQLGRFTKRMMHRLIPDIIVCTTRKQGNWAWVLLGILILLWVEHMSKLSSLRGIHRECRTGGVSISVI